MNQIIRRFKVSDAILLAHMGKILERLPEDLTIIQEAIPVIDQKFADQLKADYLLALKEGGDDVARGKVGQKTQNLLDTMDGSKPIVKKLRFYLGEVYEDNPAKRKSFYLWKYWKIANSQPELIKYMNGLAQLVEENRDELEAGGVPADLLDSVGANAKALAKADAVQESSKGGRANATQARVIALNSLYERGLKLDRATDIAFEDDPVRAAFYNMPQPAPKAEDVEEEEDGKVTE